MTMVQNKDGRWYGTLECLLTRIVGPDEDYSTPHTDTLIGYRDGDEISVDVRGHAALSVGGVYTHSNASVEWWEQKGFTVTMPAVYAELRSDTHEIPEA